MAKLVFGSLYFSTPSATTLSAATPAKAAGTTTLMQLAEFTHTTGRLTHKGLNARIFDVRASVSLTKAAGTSTVAKVSVRKNGAAVSGAVVSETIANSTTTRQLSLGVQISLAENDYLEIWLESDTGDDLTVQLGALAVSVAG